MPSIDEILSVMERGVWYTRRELEQALGWRPPIAAEKLSGAFAKRRVHRREVLGTRGRGSRHFEWALA